MTCAVNVAMGNEVRHLELKTPPFRGALYLSMLLATPDIQVIRSALQIEPVERHHLGPCSNEVIYKLLFVVIGCIGLRNSTQLGA